MRRSNVRALATPRFTAHTACFFWPSGDNTKRSMLLFDCPGTIHQETMSFFNMSVLHIPVALPHARSCVLAGGRSTCSRSARAWTPPPMPPSPAFERRLRS